MWAEGRFSHMAGFAAKARELGLARIEANTSVPPRTFSELLETTVPISSIHSPCPAILSFREIPISSLSLSSLNESKRMEAISFTKRTIDLAANMNARAIVLHMGEAPVDLNLQDRLYRLHDEGYTQTEEYGQAKEKLVHQRISLAHICVDGSRRSLQDLSKCSRQKGIMLGLETRLHFREIPNMDEMAEPVNGVSESQVGYWHDPGHAKLQQQLGFSLYEESLSRFKYRMVGIQLHDIRAVSDHQAPGTGNMNWQSIAKYLRQGIAEGCEIGEWNDEEQMQGIVKLLQKKAILD